MSIFYYNGAGSAALNFLQHFIRILPLLLILVNGAIPILEVGTPAPAARELAPHPLLFEGWGWGGGGARLHAAGGWDRGTFNSNRIPGQVHIGRFLARTRIT